MWPRCWINKKISQKLFIRVCSTLKNTWSEFRPVKARLDSLFNFNNNLKLVRKDHFRFYKTITLSLPNLRICLNSNLNPNTASITIIIIIYKKRKRFELKTLRINTEIISKFNKNNIILNLNTNLVKIIEKKIRKKCPIVKTKRIILRICNSKYNSTLFFSDIILKPPRFIF